MITNLTQRKRDRKILTVMQAKLTYFFSEKKVCRRNAAHRTDDSSAANLTAVRIMFYTFDSSLICSLEQFFAKHTFTLQIAVSITVCMLCNLLLSSMVSLVSPAPPFFSSPKN